MKETPKAFFGFFSASKKSELLAQAIYIHPEEINMVPVPEKPRYFTIQKPKNYEMLSSKNDRTLILVTLETSNGSRVMTWVPYLSDINSDTTIHRSKSFFMERLKSYVDIPKPKRENSGKNSFLKSSLEVPQISHILPNHLRIFQNSPITYSGAT